MAKIEGIKSHKVTKDGAMTIATNVVRKDITPNFVSHHQLKIMLPHLPKRLKNLIKIGTYRDKRKLTNLTKYKGGRVVVTANNSILPITHIASANLALFRPNDVKVFQNEKITGAPIMQEKRLQTVYVKSAQEAYVNKARKSETIDLWHARLVHMSYYKLKIMIIKSMLKRLPHLDVQDNAICVGCKYGKAH
ncbi:hypothetical protein ACH5RR_018060 [Cinchona calisaya]|uniref:GAG-pre-integrase domain-containing protein n=1 Tax=Cinchona calisaya TaxID=153742 RepID=A0ABD2ZM19_9GENT